MPPTPWTKKSSSLPSDRIRSNSPSNSNVSSGKGKDKAKDPPQSKVIRKLEALADGLRGSTGKENDPKGGCFCQARNHALSSHIPICRTCGLILCELNLPYFACPHCSSQILTPSVRTSLIARLEVQISERLVKEEREREQAIEEARKVAGAFPTLAVGAAIPSGGNVAVGGTLAPRPINPTTQNQIHKVLSVNSKTKKVTVSYTKSPAVSRPASRPLSRAQDEEPEPVRVPKPPAEVAFVGKFDPARPWADLKSASDGVKYIPSPASERGDGEGTGEKAEGQRRKTRRNRGGKRKRQEKENEAGEEMVEADVT